MGRVCMVRDLVAELVMGRVCYGPSSSCAEFVMGRDVPESSRPAHTVQTHLTHFVHFFNSPNPFKHLVYRNLF